MGSDRYQREINAWFKPDKPVNRERLEFIRFRSFTYEESCHAALHLQKDFAVKVVELADAAPCDQVPFPSDHIIVIWNYRLLIDGTKLFKFQAGCL